MLEDLARDRLQLEMLRSSFHDVKSDLDAVQLALRGLPSTPQDVVADFDRNAVAERLHRVVRSLSEVFRASRSASTERDLPSNVRAACEEAISALRGRGARATFTVAVPKELTIPIDTPAVLAMFHSLLRNAVEATDDLRDPRIRIITDREETAGWMSVTIRDNGCGMDPATARLAPNPGFSTKPGASGFGLFIARRVVERGGGLLTIQRSTPGVGSDIRVAWPVRPS